MNMMGTQIIGKSRCSSIAEVDNAPFHAAQEPSYASLKRSFVHGSPAKRTVTVVGFRPHKGLKELDTFLSALPKNMQRNAYSAGLRAAAKVIVTEARIRAPKKSGKMAKAIKAGSVGRSAEGHMAISVRLDPRANDHAFLGLFHEYGTAAHYITAGTGELSARKLTQALRRGEADGAGVLVINGNPVGGAVLHPGHAAQPFLRPALDIKADEAVRAFAGAVRGYLEGKTGFVAPMDEAA